MLREARLNTFLTLLRDELPFRVVYFIHHKGFGFYGIDVECFYYGDKLNLTDILLDRHRWLCGEVPMVSYRPNSLVNNYDDKEVSYVQRITIHIA